VLSQEALKRLATDAFSGKYAECPSVNATGSEDADMGKQLILLKNMLKFNFIRSLFA
jgi:hypothetical protein